MEVGKAAKVYNSLYHAWAENLNALQIFLQALQKNLQALQIFTGSPRTLVKGRFPFMEGFRGCQS